MVRLERANKDRVSIPDGSNRVCDAHACNVRRRTVHTSEMISYSHTTNKFDRKNTYGSPITNVSPAFTDGTRPSEPTNAAAASLVKGRVVVKTDAKVQHGKRKSDTHEMMSPYILGATATSNTLQTIVRALFITI